MPIIAAFPNSVVSFTEKFDFTDVVFAAHINALQAEVAALETIIGTVPQGTAATVKARIQAIEANIAVLSGHFDSGGQIPQSGVTGLVAALAGKSPTGHTHVDADITDLSGANVFHANLADSATNAAHATNADNATNAAAVPWTGVTGKPFSQAHFGQVFIPIGSIDSGGRTSFAHGMSPQPSAVVLVHYTGGGDGGPVLFTVRSITSTLVNIRSWEGTSPYQPVGFTGYNLFWIGLV